MLINIDKIFFLKFTDRHSKNCFSTWGTPEYFKNDFSLQNTTLFCRICISRIKRRNRIYLYIKCSKNFLKGDHFFGF